jgi:hypothetical protein
MTKKISINKKYINKHAAKWIRALQSGTYKQDKNFLCAGNGFCCLGVLADLEESLYFDEFADVYRMDGTGSSAVLSEKLTKKYGLISVKGAAKTPFMHKDISVYALSDVNDNGTPFEMIAEILLTHPEQFFKKIKGKK